MKPKHLIALAFVLALLAGSAVVRAEEPLLHGGRLLCPPGGGLSVAPATDSEVATWLSFRYDAHKETGLSLPGQKEYENWLVKGRCHWLEGMNVAAGYQVWSPNLDAKRQIYTTRTGVGYQAEDKGAEIAVERSTYADPTHPPSYGAVAAFTMQF